MNNDSTTHDCLVVGAGLSGLVAARSLADAGVGCLVVDKGRGLGGRLATRRIREISIDHGAQFFTVGDPEVARLVSTWSAADVARSWKGDFSGPAPASPRNTGEKYIGREGMTALAKHLGLGLDIRRTCRLTKVGWQNGRWRVENQDGEPIQARSLVLTPPVPQSLDLLQAGAVRLPEDTQATLRQIRYVPCLAALVLLQGPSQIPEPGGVWLKEPLTWMADNNRKGIQTGEAVGQGWTGVTIQSGGAFAEKHWDDDPDSVARTMCDLARHWLGEAEVLEMQLHRWRFAQVVRGLDRPCLALQRPGPLVLAGDAFGPGGVQGAIRSGWAAAEQVQKLAGASFKSE